MTRASIAGQGAAGRTRSVRSANRGASTGRSLRTVGRRADVDGRHAAAIPEPAALVLVRRELEHTAWASNTVNTGQHAYL